MQAEEIAKFKKKPTPRIDVSYVAHLARISLSSEQIEKFGSQLQQIVAYVEKLKEVNVEGIEPTFHPSLLSKPPKQGGIILTSDSRLPFQDVLPSTIQSFRADEPRTPGDPAPFMKNAPQQANHLFVVPKIVE